MSSRRVWRRRLRHDGGRGRWGGGTRRRPGEACRGDSRACCQNLRVRGSCFFSIQKKPTSAARPFLTQSDWSVENGLFRLKPESGFLTQSKKGIKSKNSVEKNVHVFF